MGGKNRERRQDPLLHYLLQARNSDEHGLEPVAEIVEGSLTLRARGVGQGGVHIRSIVLTGDRVAIDADHPERLSVEIIPTTARLIRVYDDRNNTWYDPPVRDPIEAASLALEPLEGLVSEAESLPWLS
jgi:hypothetical protein